MFEEFFEASSVNTDFRLLLASSTAPTYSDGTWNPNVSSTSQVVLVSSLTVGTSGLVVPRSTTSTSGFNVSSGVELSASAARAVLMTAGDVYQYSGTITGARYVLLTESKAAFAPTAAEIYAWWDIGTETSVSIGNTLTLTSLSLQGN
tara:strand:+ start:333 stop:776 length:444 start_codon:yes stop_codon:yes gene_type:complete